MWQNESQPLVCLDETSKQLTRENRTPIPMRPGREVRFDYEYERAGVASLFMLFAPPEGWRHVPVRERRTAIDYALILKDLSDTVFPGADKIVLVQDNLNTHSPASLYKAFPPPGLAASPTVLSGTTHPNMVHGSTSQNAN